MFREDCFYCSNRDPLLRCRLVAPVLTRQLLSILLHTQEFADKLATDKASLPEELKHVIDNNALPEVQFKTAAKTSDGTFLVKGFCDEACMLRNLKSRADLNNRSARVCKAQPREDGRIGVELMIGKECMWVKPENLRAIHDVAVLSGEDFAQMRADDREKVGMFLATYGGRILSTDPPEQNAAHTQYNKEYPQFRCFDSLEDSVRHSAKEREPISFVHNGVNLVMDNADFVRYTEEHFPHGSIVKICSWDHHHFPQIAAGAGEARVLRPRWDGTSNLVVCLSNGAIVDVPISSLTVVSKKTTKSQTPRSVSDPRPAAPARWNLSSMTQAERSALNESQRPLKVQMAVERDRVAFIDKHIKKESERLSNTQFCKRAPVQVVAEAREHLSQLHKEREVVVARLNALEMA